VRDGAWVAEVTDLLDLSKWPAGMRVIVRKERPHAGAQLRLTDAYGRRLTTFATNTARGQLADLELRHRRPAARCEDRIRCAKDTGLMNLPLHDLAPPEPPPGTWNRRPPRRHSGQRSYQMPQSDPDPAAGLTSPSSTDGRKIEARGEMCYRGCSVVPARRVDRPG